MSDPKTDQRTLPLSKPSPSQSQLDGRDRLPLADGASGLNQREPLKPDTVRKRRRVETLCQRDTLRHVEVTVQETEMRELTSSSA